MPTDIEAHLQKVVDSLRTGDVSLEEAYVADVDMGFDEQVKRWSPQTWANFPEGFESLARRLAKDYPLFGRVEMRWRSVSDPSVGGESVTPDLAGLHQARIPADSAHPEVIESAGEDLYILDDHPHTGDACVLAASLVEPRLWALASSTLAEIPVGLDVLQRAVLDMRGAFHWQWLFVDPAGIPSRRDLAVTLHKSLAALDRLWPDWDDGRYSEPRGMWSAVEPSEWSQP